MVGGKHNVSVYYVDVYAPDLSGVVLCNPFKWDILWIISDPKSCYFCVCINSKTNFIPQPQEQKSCRRHTQCSSTLCGWLCTQPIWCCPLQPFQMRYFVFNMSDIKPCFFVRLPQQRNEILFLNHRNSKVVGGKHNLLVHYVNASAPNPSGVVLWNPFKWNILLFISDQNLVVVVCVHQ